MKKIIIILLIALAIFFRLYNLQYSSRFTRDESSVLVSIKNIYQNKKITLIGPTDENGIEVFSSLPYYLFLPFCIIFGYDPMVTAYSTVFYGLLTLILFALILKKIHWSYPIFILTVIFTPLLVSSRWAWSPHLIPFFQALSLLILFSKLPYKYIITGILMGLTIHLHWFAVFTTLAIIPIIFFLNRKFKDSWQYSLGLFLSITPFILFDLTHPPGLFITRMLSFSQLYTNTHQISFLQNLWLLTTNLFTYFSGNQIVFGYIAFILTLTSLIIYRNKNNLWILPFIFQIVGLSLAHSRFSGHYILPVTIFYLFWLYKNQKYLLIKLLTLLLIVFNLLNIPTILNSSDWTSNIQAQKQIINYIDENQKSDPLFNLIVLQSPDGNTKGFRFKDQLTLKDIVIKDPAEYKKIDTLYVISYQNDWQKLSKDPAYELDNFRNLKPSDTIKINRSDWFVYKISRTIN
ncbi:MAG: hypothetical protein WC784_00240 [Candidatus Shapirobacteria bacterium]|jgi:hypothetical protein